MSSPGTGPAGGRAPATPAKVSAAVKRAKAMQLRRAGASFEAIAKEVGYSSKGTAYKAVMTGLAQTTEEAAAPLRVLEAERLDALQLAAWRPAMSGDLEAIRTVLKVMERRAKMLGLDMPVEFTLRLEAEQVEFMEGTMRRFLDGVAAALTAAGHGDVVEETWDVVSGEVLARELTGLAAAAGEGGP